MWFRREFYVPNDIKCHGFNLSFFSLQTLLEVKYLFQAWRAFSKQKWKLRRHHIEFSTDLFLFSCLSLAMKLFCMCIFIRMIIKSNVLDAIFQLSFSLSVQLEFIELVFLVHKNSKMQFVTWHSSKYFALTFIILNYAFNRSWVNYSQFYIIVLAIYD